MTDSRVAYDDPSTLAEMGADCRAAQSALAHPLTVAAHELSREQTKRAEIEVPAAAARLAAALNLQLDGE